MTAALVLALWQPAGLVPSATPLADVLARVHAAQTLPAADAQRRERWTYHNGPNVLPVVVTVRGAEYRADVAIGAMHYEAGMRNGLPWRADGNGIAHATTGDEQGDAVDRLPRALLPFDDADCALAGEVRLPAPAWVVVDRPPADRAHWFFVDQASGRIVREQTREGKRVVTIDYDDFVPFAGVVRPQHWHVAGGDRADDLDVRVDSVEPGPLDESAVALPQQERLFEAAPGTPARVGLPVEFRSGMTYVEVDVDGHHARFVLDSGTQSIMLDSERARAWGLRSVLGHAVVPRIAVGPFALSDASVLALSLFGGSFDGIIGYDFFVGHVLHVDQMHEVVELLTPTAAAPLFDDPRATIVAASFEEGLPIVAARVDGIVGWRFALDTGSPGLEIDTRFTRAHPAAAMAWTPTAFRRGFSGARTLEFLEGSVEVLAHRIHTFGLGPVTFTDVVAGVEIDNTRDDAIELPFDGIVGTDELRFLDLWFDYDGGRIAMLPQRA
ncbi:MAG: retropepsin-like aspartic protease [Vulcanimicrobiaceae bacterium]|jgi:hypothetical protein